MLHFFRRFSAPWDFALGLEKKCRIGEGGVLFTGENHVVVLGFLESSG